MMIPVKGHPNLYRDEDTGAIINVDDHSFNQYKNATNNRLIQKKELENIKNEMQEIKSLLKELINESR